MNNVSGYTNRNKVVAKAGQAFGDGLSIVTGVAEMILGGGSELASVGTLSPVAIPLVAHGASSVVMGGYNLIKGSQNPGQRDSDGNSSTGSSGNTGTGTGTKQSKVEKTTKTEKLGDGKFTKTTEVRPGRDPGQTRAEYIRYKNKEGKVIKNVKDTYDRANKFIERKSKELPKKN